MRSSDYLFAGTAAIALGWAASVAYPTPIHIPFEMEVVQLEIEYDYTPTIELHGLADFIPSEYVHTERQSDEYLIRSVELHPEWDQIRCLALNTYHEARGSTLFDQKATAHVVLNRMEDDRYPSTACEVVYDDRQFSWTHDRITDYPHEWDAWITAQVVAYSVYNGLTTDITNGATHYHTTAIRPYWSVSAINHQVIGAHVYMEAR